MTKREGAIITARTGNLCCNFSDFHEYAEEIMGRPVFTHEFGVKDVVELLKAKSKNDFIHLMENLV